MGWEDRPYYREGRRSAGFNPLTWLMSGSVPLFTAFGIRVRAHASLVILVVLVLLGAEAGLSSQDRVISMSALFLIVLLHEFGHCFTARWVGGSAEDILMTPLGGIAMAHPPHRPLPTFLTVAGGPAVNVLLCILCAAAMIAVGGANRSFWNPLHVVPNVPDSFLSFTLYAWWIYKINLVLLLFNLWPIFPLDGGQMLQSILWPHLGYYKSMTFACVTGMVGAVVMAMVGVTSGRFLLLFIAISCFLYCYQRYQLLKSAGPDAFDQGPAYAVGSYTQENRTRRRTNDQTAKRLAKLKQAEGNEQTQIDAILAKVSASGMNSLSWMEKRALRQATERQRKRDLERQQLRR